MLNGEVVAANTRLSNMVGEIQQAAGPQGGGPPGMAEGHTPSSFVPLVWRQWWLPAGATL